MSNDPMPPETMSGSARVWIHFAVLVVLAGVVELVAVGSVGQLTAFYYAVLPVLAAISVGILTFEEPLVRSAGWLTATATVLMIVLDLVGAEILVSGQRVVLQEGGIAAGARFSDFTRVDLFGTIAALVHGDLVWTGGIAARLDPGDPRLRITAALLKAGHLFLPLALVGIVVGVQAWIADHVMFRRPIDGRVAHIILAWLLAPALFFLAVSWTHEIRADALLGGSGPLFILLPYAPFLVVGVLGWAMAVRISPWVHMSGE